MAAINTGSGDGISERGDYARSDRISPHSLALGQARSVSRMKLAGTKSPKSTRVLAVVTFLLTIAMVIFFAICVRLGKV